MSNIEIKKPSGNKNINPSVDNDILFESLNKQEDNDDFFDNQSEKIVVSCYMEKTTYQALEKLAKKKNMKRGVSKMIQKACEDFLAKYGESK